MSDGSGGRELSDAGDEPLASFGRPVRDWFDATFEGATPVQRAGWAAIAAGEHSLLLAPTGSGKTLAAFLWALNRLFEAEADDAPGYRALYVSPLKALAYDVDRNLGAPLTGIAHYARRDRHDVRVPRVDLRTGDTSSRDRRRQAREPGEILVTTPESLYLILSSKARATLTHVHTVIIDEVHALAGTKRGAHLALSLERLAMLTEIEPQRIGLTATIRPADEAARFLAGRRPVTLVDTVAPPSLDLKVSVPVPDMDRPGRIQSPKIQQGRGGPLLAELAADESDSFDPARTAPERGIWDALYPALLEEVRQARSTIIFVNSRSLAERLAQRLNELAEEELAWAHHGSVSHEKRAYIEEGLKSGEIRCIVATSTMELGVDMGRVDKVVLVESPGAVSRGLQRVGRAGHQVGAASAGRIYPKYRGDLLEATVVAERMVTGSIEAISMPRNPLDVLAQQICAMCCDHMWSRQQLADTVRRAGPFAELGDASLDAVLDMLSGRYAATAGLELPPRIVWDRANDQLSERRGTAMVVRVNAGTIPDRGLYAVHLGVDGPRLGELDEEMVFESRAGEVFMLGASSWRVQDITRDRVIVTPAPGEPGKLPFWRGDGPGRPAELGQAIGERTAALASAGNARARKQLEQAGLLDDFAISNLLDYISEQKQQTGEVPSDRTIVVERFRDELGDWRVCILSPYGARVHAPWAMALERRLGALDGLEVQLMYADDGIVIRFADTEDLPALDLLFPGPDEVEELLLEQLGDTARFAGLFRENAARALLMPRRKPTARSPLWAQRLKSARLLAQVRSIPDFPIVLETYREALSDAFDLPALKTLLGRIASGGVRVHEAVTDRASPFARSLVFAYVAAYLYERDAPLAERRAQALSIDRDLLAELVGSEALRDLIDVDVLARVERILQGTELTYQARDANEVEDLLNRVGDLSLEEIGDRTTADPELWLKQLEDECRAATLRLGGEARWIAAPDAGLYAHALGAMPPAGLPAAFLEPAPNALRQLIARFARRRGPFVIGVLAHRYGLVAAQLLPALQLAERDGELVHGPMRPAGSSAEWCDAQVLRRLKRETLAHLRKQVAPVDAPALAAYLPRWQGIDGPHCGVDRLLDVIEQLEGVPALWSVWCEEILPRRVRGFNLDQLEQLCAMGQVVWIGAGAKGPRDGRVMLFVREHLALFHIARDSSDVAWERAASEPILNLLLEGGARFQTDIELALAAPPSGESLTRKSRMPFGRRSTHPGSPNAPSRLDRGRPLTAGTDERVPGTSAVGAMPEEPTATFGFDSDAIRDGLRELMWAGVITNDTLAPLRALANSPARQVRSRTGRVRIRNGVPGGRWGAVPVTDEDPTAAALLRAETLLGRYGIVSREMALAEGVPGGFTSVYPVLRQMEEGGRVRRGYFVEGLSGAQFAVAGAVDRLRECVRTDGRRREPEVLALSCVDPANPYGTLTAWPAMRSPMAPAPRRVAGSWLVLIDGEPVVWFAAGRRSLTLFGSDWPDAARSRNVLEALANVPRTRRHRQFVVDVVDGAPIRETPLASLLGELGYAADHRGYTLPVPGLDATRHRA
jgi:ATP-dependent Lhr-like helicase